tara:strand:- start:255 stop:635 length:381 start_codon:yes stop_codon:yes gene_type:complete
MQAQPKFDLEDIIITFNNVISKLTENINCKRDEISALRTKLDEITEMYNNHVGANDHELIELKNANKLAQERITDLENALSKSSKEKDELREQLAYSYDSGYSSEDSPEQEPPEVTEKDARQAFGQ